MPKRRQRGAASLIVHQKLTAPPLAVDSSSSQSTKETRVLKGIESATSTSLLTRNSAARGAAKVAEHIQTRADKVVDLPNQDLGASHLIREIDDDGTKRLRLVTINKYDRDFVFDLSILLSLPNLATPLAEGIKNYVERIAARGRYNAVQKIKLGLLAYLVRHNPQARLEDLDQQTLTDYVRWQVSAEALSSGDASPSSETARGRINTARAVLKELLKSPPWKLAAERALEVFPQRTHKKLSRGRDAAEKHLPLTILQDILYASLDEIQELTRRLDEGDNLLEVGRRKLAEGNLDYGDLSVAFAQLVEYYPGIFPLGSQLMREHPKLGRHIYSGCKVRHGLTHLARYRYAETRDLVPLVLLLAIEGAYNAETILGLELSSIKKRTVFGISVIEIEGPKGRASDGRYGKDLDPDVVEPWLSLLIRLTSPLRDASSAINRDRLFIFAPDRSSMGVKSFSSETGYASTASMWKWALKDFREHHKLPHFTLSDLRKTMLDATGERQGSLIAHFAARHKRFETTDGHYLGPGTRARDRDLLGETVQQMERFAESKGKIDVRRFARAPSADKGAATPGFYCDDPYDSPIAGQIRRRLCRAYGLCPVCPLANAKDDPESVAQWIALTLAIQKAREQLDPQHWLEKWAPVATRLLALISQVPETVMTKASLISIELPSVA